MRAGELVFVSGCSALADEGYVIGGVSGYEQTTEALRRVADALGSVGASLTDVVQTRLYLTDVKLWEEVGRAHREVFEEIRPAATLVEVSALIDPRMLVEVEALAVSAQAAEPAASD